MPKYFDELVKVFTLCHGTDAWSDNAELLLEEEKADLSEIIPSVLYHSYLAHFFFRFMPSYGMLKETAVITLWQGRKNTM